MVGDKEKKYRKWWGIWSTKRKIDLHLKKLYDFSNEKYTARNLSDVATPLTEFSHTFG